MPVADLSNKIIFITGAGAGIGLSGPRPQIQRGLCGLQGRAAGGKGNRFSPAAQTYPQCRDGDDEGDGVRRGLCL